MLRRARRTPRPPAHYTTSLPAPLPGFLPAGGPPAYGPHAARCTMGGFGTARGPCSAEATLENRPDGEAGQQDEYARWYLRDADRVVQVETYEGAYHHDRRIRVVCALLRAAGVRRVLDLGCGDGWQVAR